VRVFTFIVFLVLYGMTTVFGLGPVMFADGNAKERLLTLIAVIVVYAVITAALLWSLRKLRKCALNSRV
jgi:hypothetical protein